MKVGVASGMQLAFLTTAMLLLVVPLEKFILKNIQLDQGWVPLLSRAIPFAICIAILLGVPRIREQARADLRAPIPPGRRLEVLVVTLLKLAAPLAVAGFYALSHWMMGGSVAVEQNLQLDQIHDRSAAIAFSIPGALLGVVLAGLVAPVIEELLFRGFIYRAWERQWGWIPSMILTSLTFGVYHTHFLSAFVSSLIFVCIYRRTGTLVAPIIVHAAYNVSLWYPLLGQFMFPGPTRPPGDPATWSLQMAALTVLVLAVPVYIFMARHKHEPANLPVGQ